MLQEVSIRLALGRHLPKRKLLKEKMFSENQSSEKILRLELQESNVRKVRSKTLTPKRSDYPNLFRSGVRYFPQAGI